jgi:hypothetical protein
MPWIEVTQDPGVSFGNTGEFFWSVPTETLPSAAVDFTSVAFPSGINSVNSKISAVNYANRFYALGGWTDNMVFTEEFALWIQGLQPPTIVPSLAVGAGAFVTIGYLTFARYNANDVLEERSSLSAPSATLTGDLVRTWSSIPTPNNTRATHIEFWVSVDGALPRMSVRRQVGVTSVVESVATASLGEAFGEEFTRFPRGKFNAVYHDRQVIAGDDRHPDTLHFSGLFTPERYEGLNLKTRNGEPIIGLATVRDMLLVVCPRSSYVVQGYTEDDLTMQISEPNIGAISHHALVVVDGRAFIFSDRGPYIFDGMWHFIGEGMARKFRAEYETYRTEYEDAFAVEDKVENVVKFGPVLNSDIDAYVYWVCDYRPALPTEGGYGQPNWSYDARSRKDDCAGELSIPGSRRGDLYTGSCDGFIRQENDYTDGDDDGDSYGKKLTIRTGHLLFNDPGGGRNHGKKLLDFNLYVRSEETSWGFGIFGGDEYAYPAVDFQYGYDSIAASALSPGSTYQPRTVWHFRPTRSIGRGFTFNILGINPTNMLFTGLGGAWKRGRAVRREVTSK